MRTLVTLIFFAGTALSYISPAQEVYVNERLERLWESSAGLRTPESVLYDPSEKMLYVSNINENPWEKDNNGYISRHKENGTIINYEWVKEMSAPKGMGLLQGKLYVTNIDEVVEIDIAKAEITQRFRHQDAVNLNDIAIGPDGRIFVSDSKGNYLFEIHDGVIDVLHKSADGPTNGLFYENGLLLCGKQNQIVAFDLNTKTVSPFIEGTGPIDGIEGVGDNTYLISDWSGNVHLVQKGKPKVLLLNTTEKKINAADIEFDTVERILYVPTFFNNSLVAYKLKE